MNFTEILKAELPNNYKIFSFYNSEDYDQPKIFIANRQCLDYGNNQQESILTKMQYNFPYVTGIDIFPLDYVPSDPALLNTIINLYISAYDLAFNYDYYRLNGELESYLAQLESILNTEIKRDNHLRTTLWKMSDAIAMMTYEDEAKEVAYYPSCVVDGLQTRRNAHDFSDTKYLDFEMLKLPVPGEYKSVLSSTYGEDYMKPVRGGAWHMYPFYKTQDKRILFNSKLGQMGDIF
jgi:lipopolysaccharide cholinephosphotransferase